MKLKNKMIITTIIMFFCIIIVSKWTFAKTLDNSFFNSYIPDGLSTKTDEVTDSELNKEFAGVIDEYYVDIDYMVSRYSVNLTPCTENDMNEMIQRLSNTYKEDLYGKPTGKSIELNGMQGHIISYNYISGDYIVPAEIYYFKSDHCKIAFIIAASSKSFMNSTEYKKIINSFKIKDTVLISRGIPFTDVASWDWYLDAVKYVYNNGMIKGLNDYTFGPNNKLTRGMIVTILYRMEGSPTVSGTSGFSDVKETEYYAKAVKWAKDKKIVSGYSGTTKFGPNDNILRQDLAGILRNYAKYKGKNVNVTSDLTKFKDYKKVDSYANASMQWAVGKKVMNGNKDGTLNPKGNASRAEAAAMLKNYCENVGK